MSRPAASDRVRRMLSLVPWVASHPDGVPLDEVCARFQVDPGQLERDIEIASMVGLYPFTPDVLMEVMVDEGRVFVDMPHAFDRPLRLTPEQAVAMVTAGASLLAVPGADPDGPLARGLAKLAEVLGAEPGETIDIEVGSAPQETLELLGAARRDAEQVQLEYYSYGRDQRTRRRVDPYRVFGEQGQWYLEAFCHLTDDTRVFRIDRIVSAERTGEHFDPPTGLDAPTSFEAAPQDPRVRLWLARSARWVVESYPVEAVAEREDGSLEVVLAISEPAWLARLLLRLGPEAEILDAPADLVDTGTEAAARVLARYR